ncbi:MAG: RnfABCDGE type electron transport complex subunit D [Bacillota bacterium]
MSQHRFVVSAPPHIRSTNTVVGAMRGVFLALVPAALAGTYYFGLRALLVMAITVAASVATEALIQKLMGKPITISDWSAALTGLLLAFNLPPAVPFWLPVVGAVFAIAMVKHCFGGLGHNFMNPALAARAALLAAWPSFMTVWTKPLSDGATTATPLAIAKGVEAASTAAPSYMQLFLGLRGGCIGETSVIALAIGGIYLLYKGLIDWRIPSSFIGTVLVLTTIFGGKGLDSGLYHILAGGLFLGAFYMATDYVTSPATKRGRIVYGIGCGLITVLIRLWGGYPEGVSYSILLMNVAAPLIERATMPRKFGEVRAKHA